MDGKMFDVWIVDLDTILEIIELAKSHGKKEGDDIQEEFIEVMKRTPNKFKHLGRTEKDADLLTGNLREEGLRILNLNEINRIISFKESGE